MSACSAVAELALRAVRAIEEEFTWLIEVFVATEVEAPARIVFREPTLTALDAPRELRDGLSHSPTLRPSHS